MDKKIVVTINADGSFGYETYNLSKFEVIGIVEIIKTETLKSVNPKEPEN